MPKIRSLPEDIINKIAAGEVIERPASVVKELIENCLDAGATRITIEIKDAGQELIRISDNGHGMDKSDAENCILRHATSKIQNIDDLYSIKSLGFRGEALASIAAVSKLSIKTKQVGKIEGVEVKVNGGILVSSEPVAVEEGTVIEVRELFFNTPARKKFLKSELIEMRHIIDIITRYALVNTIVAFKLINEGRELINSPSTPNLRSNIAGIYGGMLAKEMLKIEHEFFDDEDDDEEGAHIKVSGYFCKPLACRNDKTQQSLFVNKRWVKNDSINQAIYDAYHSLLFHGRHPVYVLNIDLDPESIDVNVHPNKTEIKIEQKDLVYNVVYKALQDVLKKNNLIPEVNVKVEEQLSLRVGDELPEFEREDWQEDSDFGEVTNEIQKIKTIDNKTIDNISHPTLIKSKYAFEPSEQTTFDVENSAEMLGSETELSREYANYSEVSSARTPQMKEELKVIYSKSKDPAGEGLSAADIISETQESEKTFQPSLGSTLPPMKLLGQIHKTFFIAETVGGMLIIDQHVVQERVLYEKFMNQFLNKSVSVQKLLDKELLTFTSSEKMLILQKK
ncbi:MAG: DNA mismatch repair endonuclease MutL, partial [Nanoarchaeota archaeon]|nr:DNA mismatch repair endonuclease MutL [Nanoarchaeota archaeon]